MIANFGQFLEFSSGVTVALGRDQPCPVVDVSKRSYERGALAVRVKSHFQYVQISDLQFLL